MNNLAVKRMTVPEFLAWAETQEGRYELIDGQPIAMAPERSEHVQAKRRAANALDAAVQQAGVVCEAFVDGLAVAIDQATGYVPDALVNCGEPVARELPDRDPIRSSSWRFCHRRPAVPTPMSSLPAIFVCRLSSITSSSISSGGTLLHYRKQPNGTVTVVVMTEGEIAFDPPGDIGCRSGPARVNGDICVD